MNQIIEEIYNNNYVKDKNGNEYPLHSHVSIDEGLYLTELVEDINAKVTLETGMGYGLSTLFICDGLSKNKGIKHIAIDPCQLLDPNEHDFSNGPSAGRFKDNSMYMARYWKKEYFEALANVQKVCAIENETNLAS